MTVRTHMGGVLVAALLVAGGAATPADAQARAHWWKDCDHVHHRFPHGVGKRHAHDHTSGDPVTNFKRSNRLYRKAVRHNSGLDADGDHIACEAH